MQKTQFQKNNLIGTLQIVFGYIIAIVCGLFATVGGFTSALATTVDVVMVIIFLVLTALGVLLIVRGTKRKRFIRLFKEYETRLVADPLHSINQLAAATGVSVEIAKKNILQMIHKGYFVNVYIDFDRDSLIFIQSDAPPVLKGAMQHQTVPSVDYVIAVCSGCGATNKIKKGVVGECEFCGNSLSERSFI